MFPPNTVLEWSINIYHEQWNMIIILLLLPIGHISNMSAITTFLLVNGVILTFFYNFLFLDELVCAYAVYKEWPQESIVHDRGAMNKWHTSKTTATKGLRLERK
jgi:hypothetical protein